MAMDVKDIFLQELQVDSIHPSVDKAQHKLFSAIKKGDFDKVKGPFKLLSRKIRP